MRLVIRIARDEEITKLLKRHPKYKEEYWLNVYGQELGYLIMVELAPFFMALAQAEVSLRIGGMMMSELDVKQGERE